MYVLDANVFIEAHRRYYGFPLCPGFWNALVWHYGAGHVCSIDHVRQELLDGDDRLSQWVKNTMPAACFVRSDADEVVAAYADAVRWVQAQPQFLTEAKAEFADEPDAWLIAFVRANQGVLVTHEKLAPDARKRVPVPNVCAQFGVQIADTFEMLQALEVEFSWQPRD
jgi:hypothetical protein